MPNVVSALVSRRMERWTTKSQINDALRKHVADPYAFDEFLDAWNGFFASEPVLDGAFEKDVKDALETASAGVSNNLVGPQIRRMINALPNPALVVRKDGRVISQNFAATESLSIDLGDDVDTLPFELQDGELFSAQIGKSLERRNRGSDLRFLRAFSTEDGHSKNAAILTSQSAGNSGQTALLILIDSRLQPDVAKILAEAFELTEAESEILLAFLGGANLAKIAEKRGRSLATVRTQMNTIMTKAGVSSQADLMRNALALAQFHSEVSKVAHVAKHPFRKSSAVLRPGGRSVEVTLAGDMLGKLVVVIPDITLSTFPAFIEAQFAAAGLCVVTLGRPGFGGTDLPPGEADYTEVMAEDLKALLAQLGKDRCVLVGHSTSSNYAYRLGTLLPAHISRILLLSPLPPAPYLRAVETRAPWAAALLHSSSRTPRIFSLMASAGLKAWKLMGTRQFVALQLRDHPPDVKAARRPDVLTEFEAAFEACVLQGPDIATMDLAEITRDWCHWLASCPVPVEWFQGTKEPIGVLGDSFAALAAEAKAPHRLTQIDGGGFLSYLTHTEVLIERLLDEPPPDGGT